MTEHAPQKTTTIAIFIIFIFICCGFSRCSFFGKEDTSTDLGPVGSLSNGASVLGQWNVTFSSTSATNNPHNIQTLFYSFEPNSALRVEVSDPHLGGVTCRGFGQYRIAGQDVFTYVQTADPPECSFSSFEHLGAATVEAQRIVFQQTDGSGTILFKTRSIASKAIVGLWDFQGEGGFDWIFFDSYGYFILQTTSQGEMYMLMGYYDPNPGGLKMTFFNNLDPNQPFADPLEFAQFLTDGSTLQLLDLSTGQLQTYTGTRL